MSSSLAAVSGILLTMRWAFSSVAVTETLLLVSRKPARAHITFVQFWHGLVQLHDTFAAGCLAAVTDKTKAAQVHAHNRDHIDARHTCTHILNVTRHQLKLCFGSILIAALTRRPASWSASTPDPLALIEAAASSSW